MTCTSCGQEHDSQLAQCYPCMVADMDLSRIDDNHLSVSKRESRNGHETRQLKEPEWWVQSTVMINRLTSLYEPAV